MIGQSIGNYRIVKLLGEGGMGVVYLAEHPGLRRRAAVKILHPELARRDEMVQRLFNEARAANAIGHRGIVEVSDFGVLPSGAPYLLMEFLDGQILAARIKAAGPLPPAAAFDIASQAASALDAAHARGVIHRDLKPDNLFLIQDPHLPGCEMVKILDFGIAKLAQPAVNAGDVRTRTGAILGTPRYMSPEQCRDSRDVDHRTDIYSLGVILYEMLAGEPPFVSSSWGELVHMHIGVVPAGLRTRIPDLPESVDQIVLRALEKDPAGRFQSMADLREALDGAAVPRTLIQPATAGAVPSVAPTRRLDAAPVPRTLRRTTLAGAASELNQGPARVRAGRRRPVIAAVAIGSLVMVLVGVALLSGRRKADRAPAAPARPAQPAPAAEPAAPTPDTISIEIDSAPAGARIIRERDGATLGSTPLRQPWPRGAGDESLRVEREGYRSERVIAPRDRDLSVTLDLKKLAEPALAPPPTPSRDRHSQPPHVPAATGRAPEPLKI